MSASTPKKSALNQSGPSLSKQLHLHAVCARCVYRGYCRPTHLFYSTIAHTARCPFTVYDSVPATVISASESGQYVNIEYDAEGHPVSPPTVPAHRIEVCVRSPSPSPDRDPEEPQDPDVKEAVPIQKPPRTNSSQVHSKMYSSIQEPLSIFNKHP